MPWKGGGHSALQVSLVKARALCPTVVGGADCWGSPLELSQQGEMLPNMYGVLTVYQALDCLN